MLKGVLDRIEDGKKAVILIEHINHELVISVDELPKGTQVDTWLNIEKVDGDYQIHSIAEETTVSQQEKTAHLMKKLRARSKREK